MAGSIDLNADLGEGDSDEAFERDRAILSHVTSCSIACGGHAGDERTMRRTLRAAKAAGVAVGAHPSYPDRENFGRRSMAMEKTALEESLEAQTARLLEIAMEEGVTVRHLKPHGALYNDAAADDALAAIVARLAFRHGLALYGQPKSAAARAAAGGAFVPEGFVDRAYLESGRLMPRGEAGAVIEDEDAQAAQAVALSKGKPVTTPSGPLLVEAATLCLHSDTPGAAAAAGRLRRAIEAEGIRVEAPHGR